MRRERAEMSQGIGLIGISVSVDNGTLLSVFVFSLCFIKLLGFLSQPLHNILCEKRTVITI